MRDAKTLPADLFHHAVARARAPEALIVSLPPPPRGRTLLLAAGKAAGTMAAAVEAVWDGDLSGLAVTPPGYETTLRRIQSMTAGHPVPNEESMEAARRFLALAGDLTEDDLALVLLSGGGSALLALPVPGLTLADKQQVTRALQASGADIRELNTVRKHLSAIKGGRLARAAAPARVVTRAVSDVAGDDPAVIASGPTVADPTTAGEAQAILRRYGIGAPEQVHAWLASPGSETPKPDDPDMAAAAFFQIVATGRDALEAAAMRARAADLAVHGLGDGVTGEARTVARAHADRALALARQGGRHVILSGGEVTVTLKAAAAPGGPNSEYALALALHLGGHPGIAALAADTDGIDGTGPAAGAFVLPDTLARARTAGLDAEAMLGAHASGEFFTRLGDAFITGPTRTNVNDFRAIIVDGTIDA